MLNFDYQNGSPKKAASELVALMGYENAVKMTKSLISVVNPFNKVTRARQKFWESVQSDLSSRGNSNNRENKTSSLSQ